MKKGKIVKKPEFDALNLFDVGESVKVFRQWTTLYNRVETIVCEVENEKGYKDIIPMACIEIEEE